MVLILVLEEKGRSAFKSAVFVKEGKYVKDQNVWSRVG